MGQYTLLMNNTTKRLVATNRINLRQHESLVDKLFFICEFQYSDDIDLRDFSVQLQWLSPDNVAHIDLLEKEDDVYKEKFQRYSLPITSPLNRFAGDIEVKLVFTKVDYETGKRYKLESESAIIPISTIKDYYAVLPDESFDAISDAMDRLQAMADELTADAEVYMATKADNLTLDQATNELQLTSLDKKIGDPVVIDLIDEADKELDKLDGKTDGVIDLDDIDWEDINL